MIFATVGTTHMPFARLIDGLTALPLDEVVVQHGPLAPPPGVARSVAFMSFSEMLEHFETADTVVMHAGVGSILCALRVGHTPVVLPRLKSHGETVDDHQVGLVQALAARGSVVAVWDAGDLAQAVSTAPRRTASAEQLPKPIHAAVRAALTPQGR